MNRRGFLKLATMAATVVAVPNIAFSKLQSADLTNDDRVEIGDLILEHIECFRNQDYISHTYRGEVYIRSKPSDKKYFSFIVDNTNRLKKKEFQDKLYNELLGQFIHGDNPNNYMFSD